MDKDKHVLINGTIFDGERFSTRSVVIDKGRIADLIHPEKVPSTLPCIDLQGHTLVPGYIDIQVNGGGGALLNDSPTPDTIAQITMAHRRFGTTHLLPTLISDDISKISATITAVSQAITNGQSSVLGVHLEGPFLNSDKKGIHDKTKIVQLTDDAVPILSALDNGVTLITLAPECTPLSLISALISQGGIVFAGHTNATYEQCIAAERVGLSGYTHLYNAMSALNSRAPGTVGAALSSDLSYVGLIADGYHVHGASLKLALKAKGDKALLVTDAMPSAGADIDQFSLGGETIFVSDGRCHNAAGTLAGSDLTMQAAVQNIQHLAGASKQEAFAMASLHPASAIGLDDTLGRIAPSYRASFTLVDNNDSVVGTCVDGQWIFNTPLFKQ